jgi:multidrug resistance efflux pump
MAEAVVKKIYPERAETAEAKTKPEAPASRPSEIGGLNQKLPTSRRNRVRWILFGLLPIVLIAGGFWYILGGAIMSTDDSYVDAEKVGIATDVAGTVQTVEVKDNEHVDAGQVLYRLDPRQFQIALDSAKANLAQISLNVDAMKQDYQHMLSDASAAQAQVDLDQLNFNRQDMLIKTGTTSQALYDQAKYALANSRGSLSRCSSKRKCSWPDSAAIPTRRPTNCRNIRKRKRNSTKRSGNSITPLSRRRFPAPRPACPASRLASISPRLPRRSIWSTTIMSGSQPTRRKLN